MKWPFFRPGERQTDVAAASDLSLFEEPPKQPVIFVTLFEIGAGELGEAVRIAVDRFGSDRKAVFITTSADFEEFRRLKLPFEYLPGLGEQRLHAALLDWPAYLREKWALLLAKWKPAQIVAFGTNYNRFMNAADSVARQGSPARE